MTAVVESERRVAHIGDLKFIVIQTSAACATGHTIDLNTDATDAVDTVVEEIYITLAQDDAGADVTTTWSPTTGIITMGTVSTGIHNILIIGR